MIPLALTLALALLAGLTLLQALGAAGLPVGRTLWGGQHRILPRRLRAGSVVAIALYALFATLLLSRAGVLPGAGTPVVRILAWALAAYLVLGTVMNALSRSALERGIMTPVSALLAACAATIAAVAP